MKLVCGRKEKEMKLRQSKISLFDVINYLLMAMLILITVYPFYYVICASLSDPTKIAGETLLLYPKGFTLEGYKAVLNNKNIFIGYRNTLFYVIVGTAVNIILTTIVAYSLSKKTYWGTKVMFLITFTMFFGGGLVPRYIVNQKLGLVGSPLSQILPDAIAVWNLIVMRTSFLQLPDEIEDAAKMDGCSDWKYFTKIVIPLSKATIAVMVLFYGVGHWNAWFNASIYLRSREMYPLQLFLREILILNSMEDMSNFAQGEMKIMIEDTIKYATIIVSTLPILVSYPFLQKYFVKGVMVGAIKG